MTQNDVTVYSCSGCSNVAQLANTIALRLHREEEAVMSCIAGVGGDVPSLVSVAKNAQKILALDGCPLSCVSQCLKKHDITPDVHLVLTKEGLAKNNASDVSADTSEDFFQLVLKIVRQMKNE